MRNTGTTSARFIKFGCLKDDKFCEKMSDYMLFKDLDGKYLTLKDCIEKPKLPRHPPMEPKKPLLRTPGTTKAEEASQTENASDAEKKDAGDKEPEKTTIYYVTDEIQQSQYINMFRENGMDAVILKHNIDSPFITHLESQNENVRFQRIDADVTDSLQDESQADAEETTRIR